VSSLPDNSQDPDREGIYGSESRLRSGEYFDSRDKEEVKERLGVDAKKNLILKYIGQEKSPVGLSLLDIGCGMGGFLLAGQELGMEVLGIDPSRDHSRVAKEIFGLPVLNDYFTVTGIALRKFDLMPREKSFLKLPCAVKVVRCSK
jgi:2-polyprenyl-3-methyl-5-hydroxy-6-metoxy-1,4-benzoquinol methylase